MARKNTPEDVDGKCPGCELEGPARKIESHTESCPEWAELVKVNPLLDSPAECYLAAHKDDPPPATIVGNGGGSNVTGENKPPVPVEDTKTPGAEVEVAQRTKTEPAAGGLLAEDIVITGTVLRGKPVTAGTENVTRLRTLVRAMKLATFEFAVRCQAELDGPGSKTQEAVANAAGCSRQTVQVAVQALSKITKSHAVALSDLGDTGITPKLVSAFDVAMHEIRTGKRKSTGTGTGKPKAAATGKPQGIAATAVQITAEIDRVTLGEISGQPGLTGTEVLGRVREAWPVIRDTRQESLAALRTSSELSAEDIAKVEAELPVLPETPPGFAVLDALKALADSGKIEQRGKLYFPAPEPADEQAPPPEPPTGQPEDTITEPEHDSGPAQAPAAAQATAAPAPTAAAPATTAPIPVPDRLGRETVSLTDLTGARTPAQEAMRCWNVAADAIGQGIAALDQVEDEGDRNVQAHGLTKLLSAFAVLVATEVPEPDMGALVDKVLATHRPPQEPPADTALADTAPPAEFRSGRGPLP